MSVTRTRVGIVLFLLWWLPVYLLAPAVADLLGKGSDAQARHVITIWLVVIQTALGVLGLYLAGRELFSALGRVRRRRVLPVAWRIVWSGDTAIPDEDLKKRKERKERKAGAPASGSGDGDGR